MEIITKFLNWKSIVEIVILWYVIYKVLLFLKGTKAVYLLIGIIILIISFFVSQLLGLYVLRWLLTKLFTFFLIFIVIVFQPELREGLIRLGKGPIFRIEPEKEEIEWMMREVVKAVSNMAKNKVGALIGIKREIGLKNIIESGVILNAEISSELIQNIFYPSAPLHDGGMIIDGLRIVSVGCLFPLTENPNLEKTLGMRHRAAVGLSETSDALVIIVSEERGTISLAINGQLTRNLSPQDLLTILRGQLRRER